MTKTRAALPPYRDVRLLAPAALLAAALVFAPQPAFAEKTAKIEGVVEASGDGWIQLDSSRVVVIEGGRVTGDAADVSGVRIGEWAEAEGTWDAHGVFQATRLKVDLEVPGVSFADKLRERSAREAAKLAKSGSLDTDPEVNAYVSRVGGRLVPDYARGEFDFSFSVLDDPTLNAFALPNGAVFVHTGLLARMDNEAQLATVLGHEISHVTERHGQRHYKKMLAYMIPAQIGTLVLGGEIQQRVKSPTLQIMTVLGLNLGLSAAVNGYGRTLEDQADRVGLRYAVVAGYDYVEAPKIWTTFNDVNGDESKFENFFYGDHSRNAARKENLENEIHLHYENGPDGHFPGNVEPASAARSEPRIVNQGLYQSTMLGVTRQTAVEDFDLRRYRLARKGFERVLAHLPADAVSLRYEGKIQLATGDGAEARSRALALFQQSLASDPNAPETHREMGLLYAELNRPAEAREHLQRYLDLAPPDAKDRRAVERELKKLD